MKQQKATPDAKRLEDIRKERKIGQGEMLKEAGISRAAYWRKLKGLTEFTASEIKRIGRILMIGCDELVEIFDLK